MRSACSASVNWLAAEKSPLARPAGTMASAQAGYLLPPIR
ncbi:hypothetical protein A3768_2848 [Ralstonia solanacearum]|nr:hypothetical protein F504_821 [Ralstonia pseudosolanacearum FQY_4]ANH33979.1 hypothetical protein A3768_2848 [Ralstonia solanacearum]